jgi:hypothetical protein
MADKKFLTSAPNFKIFLENNNFNFVSEFLLNFFTFNNSDTIDFVLNKYLREENFDKKMVFYFNLVNRRTCYFY